MREFDSLPPPLRRWIAEAALPWSPWSCSRIWRNARRAGASVDEALEQLSRAEAAKLAKLHRRRSDPSLSPHAKVVYAREI